MCSFPILEDSWQIVRWSTYLEGLDLWVTTFQYSVQCRLNIRMSFRRVMRGLPWFFSAHWSVGASHHSLWLQFQIQTICQSLHYYWRQKKRNEVFWPCQVSAEILFSKIHSAQYSVFYIIPKRISLVYKDCLVFVCAIDTSLEIILKPEWPFLSF